MTDKEKLLFVIANDMYKPETLAKKTGWTEEQIHDAYKAAFDSGQYRMLRKLAKPYRLAPIHGNYATFGKRLHKLVTQERQTKSLKEISEGMDVPCASLYKYMEDKAKPRRDALDRIAQYLNVSPEWLLTGMEDD